MAIYPGTEPIIESAAVWKERCLLDDGSMFTPDNPLWTLPNLDELNEHYVENPKLGKEQFLDKLEEQLEGASPGAIRLMAEMIWVLMLFPNNFRPETKRRKIRRVWEWSGSPLPDSPHLGEPLERGVGSAGPGFINHQPSELKFLVIVTGDLKRMPVEERRNLLEDRWSLVAKLDSYEELGLRQLRHIIPHLLHPESFERIASGRHKREILTEFDRPDVSDTTEIVELDRALLEVRRELEEEYPHRDHLDFYRPPVLERWQMDEPPEIEIADEPLVRAREAFLERFDDFTSFDEPGESYIHPERGYKEVLRKRLLDLAETLPDLEGLTDEQAKDVVNEVVALLNRKLDPYDWSQNLLNWRYWTFLKELEEGEAILFVRALIELLDQEIALPARVQRFNQDVWPILENHDAAGYAVSRSLPTLFLWLHEPEEAIYVRTDLFNSMGKMLTGERIFLNKRMDLGEYQKALAFARAVRSRLEEWGWHPEDMIDVQSFLWQADHALEEAKKKADEETERELTEDVGSGYGMTGSETRQLQDVLEMLEGDGFHFPPDLVANYILALQTKRFVILTGISGTGKTKLAIKVAEFLTAEAGEGEVTDGPSDRILVIAVRPDWTDPRGLIGYHNPITGEYMTTDFLRLLMRAREEEAAAKREDRPARPFFVVLDEMNLAHVEHYFSDFLSALESGRPLSLHHQEGAEDGAGERSVPQRLRIPRNVFFTGTVNVDETTHMFSPKVLDRAFTLELNDVDLDGWALGETAGPGVTNRLDLPELEAQMRWHGQPGAEEWRDFGELLEGRLRETVTGLNSALSPWGYHFGYRVAGEIASFVLLAHRQGAESEKSLWAALDLALLEKVLPKFHGTEQELESPLLTAAFVARHGRGPTDDEELRIATEESGEEEGILLPRCHGKVLRMLRRLRQSGFAAFIE